MRGRILSVMLAACAALGPLPTLAQPQPVTIEAEPDKSWTHEPTALAFPASIGSFVRTDIRDLAGGGLFNVDVTYRHPLAGIASIYVYRVPVPGTALWFDIASHAIVSNSRFGSPSPWGEPIAFAIAGSDVPAGLRQSFSVTRIGTSSGVAVVALGDWIVKLRMTSSTLDPAGLDDLMASLVRQIGWPATLPPLPPATRLQPCTNPIRFGRPATKRDQGGDGMVMGALAGLLTQAANAKAREAGDASGRPPEPPQLCIHPHRPTASNPALAAPLKVYQWLPDGDGYLIPAGDSGTLLTTRKSDLATILNKDAPASWSVVIKTPTQWINYADRDALPPPDQLIDIIQTEKPLTRTDTDGKGGITLTDEAIQKP